MLGFRAYRCRSKQGLRDLVEWWRSERGSVRRSRQARGCRFVIPIAMPLLEDGEAEAAREAVLSGWVSQGPQVAAFEREFAALVGAPYACAVSNCTTALHLALTAAGHRSGRRGDHGKPFLHRDGQLHSILRRDAGFRRYRSGHLQHRSPRVCRSDHAAHARHSCGPSDGHAVRSCCSCRSCSPSRHCPDRRRRLCRRKSNPHEWAMGTDRQSPRTISRASPSIPAR